MLVVLRERAIKLRSSGKTYSEIKKVLGKDIPKSTLSYWCKGVDLPPSYKEKIMRLNRLALLAGKNKACANKQKRTGLFLKASEVKLDKYLNKNVENADLLKLVLSILYLGEGAKWNGHKGLMLGSSDKRIIRLYINLLDRCYGIKKNDIKFRISYRADQDINYLEDYWSKALGVEKKSFYKTKPDPRTIGKFTKNTDYKGVCVASCAGSDIQLDLDQAVNILLDKLGKSGLK